MCLKVQQKKFVKCCNSLSIAFLHSIFKIKIQKNNILRHTMSGSSQSLGEVEGCLLHHQLMVERARIH